MAQTAAPDDAPETAPRPALSRGWKLLAGCWLAVLLVLAGGGATLAWLGPPAPAPVAEVPPMPPAATADSAPARTATPVAASPEAIPPALGPPASGHPASGPPASGPPALAPPLPAPAEATPSTAGQTRVAEVVTPPDPPPVTASAAPPPRATASALALPQAPEPPPLTEAVIRGPIQPGRAIPPADPALIEAGAHGPLPRIAPDGRTPIRVYGRGFDRQEARPRVGLIIGGLGMNAALSEEAIRRLPGAVTLAFSPYAPHIALLLDQARGRGMETLLALPLEPTGYPLNNPGDRALLTGLPGAENDDRLAWLMSRFTGYVGAIGALGPMRGERFAALGERLGAVQSVLSSRGLLYVDPRPGARGPQRAWGRAIDLVVDEPATRGEIELKLAALERLAKEAGSALGYAGEASPVLIDRIAAWAGSVESRGLVLAPVTALMRRPDTGEATPLPLRTRAN